MSRFLIVSCPGEFESLSYTSDGRAIPVEIRASRVDYAGTDALMLHVRDVTERKQAEERQRLMVNGLRAIVQIADDLITCTDLDSVYRLTGERAREELHMTRGDEILFQLVRPDADRAVASPAAPGK